MTHLTHLSDREPSLLAGFAIIAIGKPQGELKCAPGLTNYGERRRATDGSSRRTGNDRHFYSCPASIWAEEASRVGKDDRQGTDGVPPRLKRSEGHFRA